MSTNLNPDNFDKVILEIPDAGPDACITQKMRDELKRILKGTVNRGRQIIEGLIKAAEQEDNLASVTKAGAIYVPAAKAWQSSQTIGSSPADQDVEFTEFTAVGIDPTGETCSINFWSTDAEDVDIALKTITADSLTLRVKGVSAGQEIFLRLNQAPAAGTTIES